MAATRRPDRWKAASGLGQALATASADLANSGPFLGITEGYLRTVNFHWGMAKTHVFRDASA